MTLDSVMNSKIYVKPNAAVNFREPAAYIEPFIDVIDKSGLNAVSYDVAVADPVINQNPDNTSNISYPRVRVEAKFNFDKMIEGLSPVIGFVYSLDVQKPIIRAYVGQNVMACLNLTIFNAECVETVNLLDDYNVIYNKVNGFVQRYSDIYNDFEKNYFELQTEISQPETRYTVGKLLEMSMKGKLGTSAIVGAVRAMNDNKSKYYTWENGNFSNTKWNIYNAVTDNLKTEFIERPLKTLALSNIILN
jgi:hypothetical protein